MEPSHHIFIGLCNDMKHYRPTHSLAIISVISWLPPRHALGEYKLTCPTFNSVLFSPVGFELCRTLVVHSGWFLSWDGLVFSSSLWCPFVVLCCVAPSWCSVLSILRSALSSCSFVVAVQRFTAWKFTALHSLVVISRISFGKESLGSSQSIFTGEERVSIPWFLAVRCSTLRR